MHDLDVQIRGYLDATSEPLTVDHVLHVPVGTEPVRPIAPRVSDRRSWRGWVTAGVAAAVVLFVLGVIPVLMRGASIEPTASTVPVPTTTASETNVSPTTVAAAREPEDSESAETVPGQSQAVYQVMDVPVVLAETTGISTGFGELTWTVYESFGTSLPHGDIWFAPEIGYVAYPPFNKDDPTSDGRAYEWRSDDAVTWERRVLTEFDGYDYFSVNSGWSTPNSPLGLWAQAGTRGSSTLFVASGNTWQRVEIDDSLRPSIEGVVLDGLWGEPTSSGDTTIYSSDGRVRIPWQQYFSDSPAAGLRGEWDDATQRLRVVNADTGDLHAELAVSVDGHHVSFVDTASGDMVHEVAGTDEFPAERIIEAAQGKRRTELWIFDGDKRLVWTPNPFPDNAADWLVPIAPLAGGGFAAFIEDQGVEEVWISEDGTTWSNRGPMAFLDGVDNDTWIDFEPFAGKLQAQVTLGDSGPVELWESVDGVNWTPATFSTHGPYGPPVATTNLGWIALDDDPVTGAVTFWASVDGEAWERLGTPAGFNHRDWQISGAHGAGAAGNVLYLTLIGDGTSADVQGEEVDPNGQWLWLGTVTSEIP